MHNRRQALLALGGGAVALAGLSTGAAVLFNKDDIAEDEASPKSAGSFSDRDASYVSAVGDLNDLGAAGLAATRVGGRGRRSARHAALPERCSVRDPVLHLLRRATFGPTDADIAAGQADRHRRLARPAAATRRRLPDPVVDAALKATPTVGMTTRRSAPPSRTATTRR